jgi:GT2 family glycosyltransferase
MSSPAVVVLGMMSKMPVPGVVWQTVHYLVGLERLGCRAYYVEAHARTPSMFMDREEEDGSVKAAAFIAGVLERFDLGDRWAFHALHDDGRCYGMTERGLAQLYGSAALLINLHGGTAPLPEHAATGRLIYLETDPVQLQVELEEGRTETMEFLESHAALFTFAENYGRSGCRLPVHDRFRFLPTRQPVILDFWRRPRVKPRLAYTTVANWHQPWRNVRLDGKDYYWSKDREFRKFVALPAQSGRVFELSLSGCSEDDRRLLEDHGWRVRSALGLDLQGYRRYIANSRGEFTVAKDQNVRLRTGWFSDRSATYLAAGRPVITQETGFSDVLSTGRGLLGFSTLEEAVAAVEAVEADYENHCRAAAEVAAEFFEARKVLSRLLNEAGVELPSRQRDLPFPAELVLEPVSRRPTVLPDETVRAVLSRPVPDPPRPRASIVVATWENLVFARLCLESVLANTSSPTYELMVVDNGSADETPEYLRSLAGAHPQVRVITNDRNRGFPAAVNQGLAAARGQLMVILNDDTVVPPGWLQRLARHLDDAGLGLVGPMTNHSPDEAQIEASYRTYGELLEFARAHGRASPSHLVEVETVLMFCAALRRDVYRRVGPLDEGFQLGLFEDDDYSTRVRAGGYRVAYARDVFVHHFGQTTLGRLARSGEYGALFHANRRRFEEKWGVPWRPHRRYPGEDYHDLVERVREVVCRSIPPEATVAVISKGDDELLALGSRQAWHFPQTEDQTYAGHHPLDSAEAITRLEDIQGKGAEYLVIPRTGGWWLEHYGDFRRHLEEHGRVVVRDEDTCWVFALAQSHESGGP